MAVDRSYLPWKAAREYQDRGMKKWMGFFISEHTSALNEFYSDDREEFEKIKPTQALTYLNQAKVTNTMISVRLQVSKYKSEWIDGYVDILNMEKVSIKLNDFYKWINIEDIISVEEFSLD